MNELIPMTMTFPLDRTLDLEQLTPHDDLALADLQANILKGHGRPNTINLFLRFAEGGQAEVRDWLQQLAGRVTSAQEQLTTSARFKRALTDGERSGTQDPSLPDEPVRCLFLSASAYRYFGVPTDLQPADNAFQDGMAARGELLSDPTADTWEPHFAAEPHAMLLLGQISEERLNELERGELAVMPRTITVVGKERGRAYFNAHSEGLEHFGYVDGRSQPLFLKQDVDSERAKDGIAHWDPAFHLGRVLVADPTSPQDTAFGSYFVFRKLEQNVAGFKQAEEELADALGLVGHDRERVGAMMVGRFEDGTPLVMQPTDGRLPVTNNFNYAADKDGFKCPFHAHIRKTNPRGESVGSFASDERSERKHLMARRGIPYGTRLTEPDGAGTRFLDRPTGDVGLLFMAYQVHIAEQFEFTQNAWANNPDFVRPGHGGTPGTGIDPVIGQRAPGDRPQPSGQQVWPNWNNDPPTAHHPHDFSGFVHLKGGAYFFAPSKSGLRAIASTELPA